MLCRVPVFELSAFLAILPSVVSPRSEQDPEGHEGGERWGKLSEECTHFLLFFLCIALLFKVRCRILCNFVTDPATSDSDFSGIQADFRPGPDDYLSVNTSR